MFGRRRGYTRKEFLKEFVEDMDYEQPRRVRLEQPMQEIEELIQDGELSYKQRISVSTEMEWISSYHTTYGTALCFSDPHQGWRSIKRGFLYSYWETRIIRRVRDFWRERGSNRRSYRPAWRLTNDAALGLALARPEALWLLNALENGLEDGLIGWCGEDFYAAYLVRLFRKLKGESDIDGVPPNAEPWWHPFDNLIEQWNDERRLGAAIGAMCDYHMRWNDEGTEDHDAEFGAPFAAINPVEIHALEAVRSELGLATPRVKHELLQAPLYPVPEFAKNIPTEEILAEDELLRRIIELNEEWCDAAGTEPESPSDEGPDLAEDDDRDKVKVINVRAGKIVSASGSLSREEEDEAAGLSNAMAHVPTVAILLTLGWTKRAIEVFQEGTGADREEAERMVGELDTEFVGCRRGLRSCLGCAGALLFVVVMIVVWILVW